MYLPSFWFLDGRYQDSWTNFVLKRWRIRLTELSHRYVTSSIRYSASSGFVTHLKIGNRVDTYYTTCTWWPFRIKFKFWPKAKVTLWQSRSYCILIDAYWWDKHIEGAFIPRQISPNFWNFTPSLRIVWKLVHGELLGSEDDCNNFRPLRANFFELSRKTFFGFHEVGVVLARPNS